MDEQRESALPAIVAEVESQADVFAAQMAEMDRRIREMEAAIGDLRVVSAPAAAAPAVAASAPGVSGRKTLTTHTAQMLAKQGVAAGLDASEGAMNLEALDLSLRSLSVEQRIAVKSEMLRAGLLAQGCR